eukprot:6690080-Alexandrium_andersonii.AAC.1
MSAPAVHQPHHPFLLVWQIIERALRCLTLSGRWQSEGILRESPEDAMAVICEVTVSNGEVKIRRGCRAESNSRRCGPSMDEQVVHVDTRAVRDPHEPRCLDESNCSHSGVQTLVMT